MKFPTLITLTLVGMTTTAFAQDRMLQLEELTPGAKQYLYPEALYSVEWQGDLLRYSTRDSVFTVTTAGQRRSQMTLAEADSLAPKPAHPIPAGATANADGSWYTASEGNRLFVVSTADGSRREVSTADPGDIVWGQAVHRNEFGIETGVFWSPDGRKLAFYRMDETMVQAYPLVNTDAREAEVVWTKYPMAGMTSHQVTLGIYDLATGQTVYMKTDGRGRTDVDSAMVAPDHYLTAITWRPDGREIFIGELNRAQNELHLNAYDVATGDYLATLFVETDDKYVEPQHPLYFLPGSNDRYIWQSRRDGWNHCYLYDLSRPKAAPTQVTRGSWEVTELLGADPKAKRLYFLATAASPLEDNLYSVDLSGRNLKRLTPDAGMHRVVMKPDFTAFYDVCRSHEHPRLSQVVRLSDHRTTVLLDAASPYEGRKVPEVTVGTLKAADGETDLYYRLVKPTDFDPTRRYPAVVYLYNGPHAQMIVEGLLYDARGWDLYMANRGYVVFTIDGRGSERRGLKFEQAIWHHLGYEEGRDQMCGVRYLLDQPFVDSTRVGIHGWSYGGFMTTYMMLNYPETFKVGVAGGPVLDWSRYEVMYGERYMGTPQSNPDGYRANCLIQQAGRLQGHLLLIHDDQDGTVVPQHSMQFLKTAVKEGTFPDYFMYPGHEHNVRGVDRVHLLEKIARYFDDYLKPPSAE
jgi:dipeptidyl aminopeptidase/acylaminoacyl peptidase